MAETGVLVAVTGAWEAPLVAAIGASRSLVVLRRCADLPELLAVAATGRAGAALVSADLHRLDRPAVVRLRECGLVVVGLAAPAALREQEPRLRALGVDVVAAADVPAARLEELVEGARRRAAGGGSAAAAGGAGRHGAGPVEGPDADPEADARAPRGTAAAGGASPEPGAVGSPGPASATLRTADRTSTSDPADALPAAPDDAAELDLAVAPPEGEGRAGRLVAVWGPPGAPGRTTVATGLAAELAAAGEQVLLADADTHAASVAQVLGLLDESPGLAAACRSAASGVLDGRALARAAVRVSPGLHLLGGVSRSSRWPELAPASLDRVWEVARAQADWVVVDLGSPLEADEELSYDTAAPRRNGAALSALAAADEVLVVGAADAVGLQRLVRGLADLAEAVPGAPTPRVVVTRVRASAVGSPPERRVRDALARFAGARDVSLVPDDRAAHDAALLAGRTLVETAPRSPSRLAVAALAEALRAARPEASVAGDRGGPDGGRAAGRRAAGGRAGAARRARAAVRRARPRPRAG
ncbi:hypothetical protein [uncultured Pseudokineococcus sp.]|uniref:AAA family ATPase n=1 Tax=uncultured Pseudokineococcus sp. TaxID=1642928 RepID=UPI0026180A38|nr:hypothetical protein [uncultured Pseudokineococcus sp.]